MKFKNLIFDVDGTLLDSKAQTIKAFELLSNEIIGRTLTDDEKISAFHKPSTETLTDLGIANNQENMDKLFKYFHDLSYEIKMFDGIKDVLQKLKSKDVFMGLATNRNTMESEFALKYNGLGEFFDDFICRSDVVNGKPSGEMLLKYMSRHNLEPSETIFIGNATADHLAAIDAGIEYGLSEWGTDEYLDEDAVVLDTPEDILKILE